MKKIIFLGAGHLSKFFIEQNQDHEIIGTKRAVDLNMGCPIIPYSLGDIWNGPTDFDVVIISFPPTENYSEKLQTLLNKFQPLKKVIFISSTSVFGDGHINEESLKTGISRNAKELVKSEKFIEQLDNYLIVRPGGLIDEKRHPKNFLKKVSIISKSQTNVNLVYTADVASFLHYAMEKRLINGDYNLICDDHPTKEEFYSRFQNNISFDSNGSEYRIIDNSKSKSTGFIYQFNHLDWP